ncbi:hypothetical protein [Consotaella salsifontis]|uniref:Uncharacterized protein n=1 Tax=Consotaella salsifontis TaxID=1365950 RepID=A0A1T4NST4_9HYPH|nr:hypothetical protein [Consotaella salsifontis]SJZ82321.1 hypothetical protein SAMN05428963_103174 [Consotaella salsifontis]
MRAKMTASQLHEPRLSLLRSNADVERGVPVVLDPEPVIDDDADPVIKIAGGLLVAATLGFFITVLQISHLDPDFFDEQYFAKLERQERALDPIVTGSTEKLPDGPIPVPQVVRAHVPEPQDFSVVMIFGDEALVATKSELWRVQVGSILPGLGEVEKIESSSTGGTIVTEKAVLALQIDDGGPATKAMAPGED